MSANKFLSNLTMNYPVSGIRAMFDLAADYPGAINLCNGEPNFETPEHIKESCIQALREGRTKYGAGPSGHASGSGKQIYQAVWTAL